MKTATSRSRIVAALGAAALVATAVVQPAPAQASKSSNLKTGAIVLGVVGAYLLTKGKTVPAAIAGAGAYYAYSKSRDARRDEQRQAYYPYNNGGYAYNPNTNGNYNQSNGYPAGSFPDGTTNGNYNNGYNNGYGNVNQNNGNVYPGSRVLSRRNR